MTGTEKRTVRADMVDEAVVREGTDIVEPVASISSIDHGGWKSTTREGPCICDAWASKEPDVDGYLRGSEDPCRTDDHPNKSPLTGWSD